MPNNAEADFKVYIVIRNEDGDDVLESQVYIQDTRDTISIFDFDASRKIQQHLIEVAFGYNEVL